MVEKPLYVSVNQTNDADTEWNPRSSRKSLALEIYNREESKDPDSYPEKAIHKTLRIGQEYLGSRARLKKTPDSI